MLNRRDFTRATLALPLGLAPALADAPKAVPFVETKVSGKPRERGRQYGKAFAAGIDGFLDREIYRAFIGHPSPKDAMLRYAAACGKEIKAHCPIIHDELEGMAEGSGKTLDELVLLTLHEELYHKGALPKVPHCTAVGVGPPDTVEGGLVGQTWDWMESVANTSSIVRWERPASEGPSLLAYGFPGLWCGAGLNSAGLALCWTSANLDGGKKGARVGLPSYVLLTHLLYQESLTAVAEEARKSKHAGWFTFVLGDAKGELLNVEGSPDGLAIERATGRLTRVGFGSRELSGMPVGKEVRLHERCGAALTRIDAAKGRATVADMREWFADPACKICVGKSTIDLMVFDTKARVAHLSRGPSYGVKWQKFGA